MMNPLLLIFDLDGTLIDSRADLATAVNLMRGRFALPPLPLATVSSYVGNGIRQLVARALQGAPVDIDEAVRIQSECYRAHLVDETTLYPGVADGLPLLHAAGHRLAIATNKPLQATETILAHFGILGLFADVQGGGSTPRLKPAPDMVTATMARLGVAPGETWLIGDNDTDLECARNAGVSSVFCEYGIGDARAEVPTRRARTFADVTAMFLPGPRSPLGTP